MKKTILTKLLALVALTAAAQDRLIRVDSESKDLRKASSQRKMFDREKARLLMPQGAAFGVECIPSFSPEWTLTYDSLAQALVYKVAEKSIWYSTYGAMHKKKKIKGKNYSVPRKRPKNYVAPEAKTYSLAISDEQVQQLRAIWRTAVGAAEDREVFLLDGTKWEYFIDGKFAKSHRNKNVLVKFTNELAETVRTGNVSRKDSLFEASQNVITGLTTPPPPEVLEPGTVRRLIVINGTPLPDSVDFIKNVPNTIGELVYFNRHQQTIRSTRYYYNEKDKQSIEEKYGVKVKGTIAEYTTYPDTLCDAYVRQHPELMESRRYVEGYVLGREQMTNLFVLVDSRLKPQKIDLEFMEWLGENGVPFSIVFTKMDKLGKVAGPAAVEDYKKVLRKTWEELPPIFMTSSEDARGRDELLNYIDTINKQLKQQ